MLLSDSIYVDRPVLEPINIASLKQIVARLMIHFTRETRTEPEKIRSYYIEKLKEYPEDLVCASYFHVLARCSGAMPKLADFLDFITPAYQHRKAMRQKLYEEAQA